MSDLISRADAIDAVHEYFKGRMRKSKCDYDDELQVYVVGKEERTMLTYNKGINDKLRSLPSADAESNDLIIKGAKGIQDGLYNIKDGLIRREDAIKEMLRAHPMPSEFLKSLDIPSSCFEAGFRAAYFAVERTPSADSVSTEYAIECIDQCRERKNREITIIRERKNREIAELKKQLADRPTGEWITCGTETGALGVSYAEKKCSHCGWAHSLLIPSNYCPNCGAMMVKESE